MMKLQYLPCVYNHILTYQLCKQNPIDKNLNPLGHLPAPENEPFGQENQVNSKVLNSLCAYYTTDHSQLINLPHTCDCQMHQFCSFAHIPIPVNVFILMIYKCKESLPQQHLYSLGKLSVTHHSITKLVYLTLVML